MEGATGVRLGRQRRIMPSLFRQVRIHLAQGATPLRLAIWTISNLTGAALQLDNGRMRTLYRHDRE